MTQTSALVELIDQFKYAQRMGGAIPVTDALVQLLVAAVVELAAAPPEEKP